MKKLWTKILTLGGLVTLLALGVMAFAPTTSVVADTALSLSDDDKDPSGNYIEALATALGISVDELEVAYQAAHEKAIQQALDNGFISQEQADRLLDSGRFGFHGRKSRIGWSSDINDLLAAELGISTEELLSAQQKAATTLIEDAIASGDISEEDGELMMARQVVNGYFQDAMQAAYENAVQQALSDGSITQEQADNLLENLGADFRGFRGRLGDGFGPCRNWAP
jgi:hypothetical protein